MVVPDDKGNIFTGELPSKAVKCLPFFQGKKVMTAASLSGCLPVEFLFANLPNLECYNFIRHKLRGTYYLHWKTENLPKCKCYNHRTQEEPIYMRKLKIPFHAKNKLFRVDLSLNGN